MNELTSFNTAFMLAISDSREAGAKAERARIITLLESRTVTGKDAEFGYKLAIALIKGDNK